MILFALALAIAESEAAERPVATVQGLSDYTWRGVSRSDRTAVPRLAVSWGVWDGPQLHAAATGVKFQVPDPLTDARHELEGILGWRHVVNSDIEWTLSAALYRYPGASRSLDYDYEEIEWFLTYRGMRVELGYSADGFGGAGRTWYVAVGATQAFQAYTASIKAGLARVERDSFFTIGDGREPIIDWRLALHRAFGRIGAEISFVGTSETGFFCYGGRDWCDPRLIFSVEVSF